MLGASFFAGCGSSTVPPPEVGALSVTVSGLPANATALASVNGPGGYSHPITKSEMLSGLSPGSYTLSATQVSVGADLYLAAVSGSPATVVSDMTASMSVAYTKMVQTATVGSLRVDVSGLPAGTPAAISIHGPGSFSTTLTSSAALHNLLPGSYRIDVANVMHLGVLYAPDLSTTTVQVTAGQTVMVSFTYMMMSTMMGRGILAVEITGTPGVGGADVLISGPMAFTRTLSQSATLQGLRAGRYTVFARDLVMGASTYTATVGGSPAMVVDDQTSTVTVHYHLVGSTTGQITAHVAGLIAGSVGSVVIDGPAGYHDAVLQEPTVFSNLQPGDYTLSAQDVNINGNDFHAPVPSLIHLMAGDMITTTVTYQGPTPIIRQVSPGAVRTGDFIRLAGSNFIDPVTVTVGGVPATVNLATNTNLTITAPAHVEGDVAIVVESPIGTSTTPASVDYYTVREFAVPSIPGGPNGLTIGPDGALWFTERASGKIGRITVTGTITEFPTMFADPTNIVTGPDGNLWFTSNGSNHLGHITTAGVVTEIVGPNSPYDITVGADGALWFSESGGGSIGHLTTAGVVTEFPIPTSGPGVLGLTTGPDQNVWFGEYNTGKLGRITTAGVVTEYPVTGTPALLTPGLNNDLWFTINNAGANIGVIDVSTGVVRTFHTAGVPTLVAGGITVTSDGDVWFGGNGIGRQITRLKPATGAEIAYVISTTVPGSPTRVIRGPDGAIWYCDYSANMIGRIRY